MYKVCRRCTEEKLESDFYANCTKCKECTRIAVRANRKANLEYYKAYDKNRADDPHRAKMRAEYRNTDRGREASGAASKAWAKRNPEKRKAQNAVNNAVRDGILIRTPCEQCGDAESHGHHDDYTKPLEVRWLCDIHHKEWHRHNTPIS